MWIFISKSGYGMNVAKAITENFLFFLSFTQIFPENAKF